MYDGSFEDQIAPISEELQDEVETFRQKFLENAGLPDETLKPDSQWKCYSMLNGTCKSGKEC